MRFSCDSGGTRTLNQLIKSQLLCQLSYGAICADEIIHDEILMSIMKAEQFRERSPSAVLSLYN